eukprot:COSAG06_NODE_19058_length_854_cov_1.396825_1_plen_74_part_00
MIVLSEEEEEALAHLLAQDVLEDTRVRRIRREEDSAQLVLLEHPVNLGGDVLRERNGQQRHETVRNGRQARNG